MKTLITLSIIGLLSTPTFAADYSKQSYEDYVQSSTWPTDKVTTEKSSDNNTADSVKAQYVSTPLMFEEEVLMRDLMGENIHYP